jgi:CheY-like chemotaxis protein
MDWGTVMSHEHFVLVVDDEPHTRQFFAEVLRESGARVAIAGDGLSALEVVRGGAQPCVVLTDVWMPGMDGWELERTMRDALPEAPVVLLTGDRLLSVTSSVQAKPADPAEVVSLVDGNCTRTDADDGSRRSAS